MSCEIPLGEMVLNSTWMRNLSTIWEHAVNHPTRSPGAKILDVESNRSTRSEASKERNDRGRSAMYSDLSSSAASSMLPSALLLVSSCNRFYQSQIPSYNKSPSKTETFNKKKSSNYSGASDSTIDYAAETRWSALCACLKEEILEIFKVETRKDQTNSIQTRAEEQWQSPPRFRIIGTLTSSTGTPFERNFLVSARLNHLHVLFLVHLMLLDRNSELSGRFLNISQEILSLVEEAIVVRDRLANAAGIVPTFVLDHYTRKDNVESVGPKTLSDLTTLCAEIEIGALGRPEEPNFALLSIAIKSIRALVDLLVTGKLQRQVKSLGVQAVETIEEIWCPWDSMELWEVEIDFWDRLTENLTTLD
ncbi:hypothetical protein DL98DRAFT_534396 [Cadophora sp. DSE1049]|nr:hypothetical protein DL98DRAFT_534396 [Cadophora sp. DSE1049]